MPYKAIIFDLDGVICHTDQYHYKAWKAIADKLNIYFDEEINNRLRGVSRAESFEIILERYDGIMSEEDKIKYTIEKNTLYKEFLKEMSPKDLSTEVESTLKKLRTWGIKLAIGSSSKNAGFILERIGLGDFFDTISDGNNISHSKPNPEVFLKASALLGIAANECLVVEDAAAGLEAARVGDMDCAAIGDAAKNPLATYKLDEFSNLLSICMDKNKLKERSAMDLKAKPFYLEDEDIAWVEKTLTTMTKEDKVGQLFCLCAREGTEDEVKKIYQTLKPGGIMFRPFSTEEAVNYTAILKKYSDIPMLIAANLEKGGNGIVHEGTTLGSPLEVAATDDISMAEKLGTLCGREGGAVGANWAFAPIIDIDYNFRNPITNIRTFGSCPERVKNMGLAYVKAVQACGLAASIKHFPGDGVDERDQHLVTSINSLSVEEWDETYGKTYKACIEAGAITVMIGHIMQPAYSRKLNPAIRDEEILPASLSSELMQKLLREQLGFNGLIVTDATTMAGFTIPMNRKKAVPYSIAAGADMFLFTRNLEEDYSFMMDGVRDNTITPERLDEAVTRILALKAALKLHTKQDLPTLKKAQAVIGCAEHLAWAKECADKSVTLVKEEKSVLPITPAKYKRVLYYPIESEQGVAYSVKAGVCQHFAEMLAEQGFHVDTFVPSTGWEGSVSSYKDTMDNYDLVVYFANMSTKSNQTTVRIEWAQPMGANVPCYIQNIPTLFISVENPYHLLDVPRVKTFINAYNSNDTVLEALMDKLTGKSEFKGTSPVDAFCGRWDTKL